MVGTVNVRERDEKSYREGLEQIRGIDRPAHCLRPMQNEYRVCLEVVDETKRHTGIFVRVLRSRKYQKFGLENKVKIVRARNEPSKGYDREFCSSSWSCCRKIWSSETDFHRSWSICLSPGYAKIIRGVIFLVSATGLVE